jgi:hypothetical protein
MPPAWCPRCGRRLRDAACVDCPPERSTAPGVHALRPAVDALLFTTARALETYGARLPPEDVARLEAAAHALVAADRAGDVEAVQRAMAALEAVGREVSARL